MPEASAVLAESRTLDFSQHLLNLANEHPCSSHPLFDFLESNELDDRQAAALLRNYDAHASVLRRLLLNAAAIMPEHAVPFVLENVRNEYGNGDYARNHQDQLRDLAWSCGISRDDFFACKIQNGVSEFIKAATQFYSPSRNAIAGRRSGAGMRTAAIVAGAVSATEILAIKEFVYIQKPFARRGLEHHIWFHHITIEEEHTDESLSLARCFEESEAGVRGVEFGLTGVLDANCSLYDGLLAACQI